MKNNTIEILAEGRWVLPVGTIARKYNETGKVVDWVNCLEKSNNLIITGNHPWEADFSNVQPLYPHKGMKVPIEGIEFANGDGLIIDAGKNGLTYEIEEIRYISWEDFAIRRSDVPRSFELKRILPKNTNSLQRLSQRAL